MLFLLWVSKVKDKFFKNLKKKMKYFLRLKDKYSNV